VKITFIYPAIGHQGRRKRKTVFEPLSIAALAGLTPDDVKLEFFDDRVEEIDYEGKTDLVAISVETHTARRAYQVASRYRHRGVPVVLGGFHPTLAPTEASCYADSVVTGPAETAWETVLQDAGQGKLKPFYRGNDIPPVLESRYRREIFRGKGYAPVVLMETGRGCVNRCDFCSVHRVFGGSYACRPLQAIVEELRNQEKRLVLFVDDNITASPDRAKALFEALIPLRIRWAGQAPVSAASDRELLRLMAASGCFSLLVGFETFSPGSLAQMQKPGAVPAEYGKALSAFREAGILVDGSFIFGYDGDTSEGISQTLVFAMKEKMPFAFFNHLRPYPGTAVYERLKSQGRLRNDGWWLSGDFGYAECAFAPAHMSAQELSSLCSSLRERFYSPMSILARSTGVAGGAKSLFNLFLYLYLNFYNGREVRQKKHLRFGSSNDDEPIPLPRCR